MYSNIMDWSGNKRNSSSRAIKSSTFFREKRTMNYPFKVRVERGEAGFLVGRDRNSIPEFPDLPPSQRGQGSQNSDDDHDPRQQIHPFPEWREGEISLEFVDYNDTFRQI
jgi:hypothetical protein